ncbi:nitroreductase family protein [Maridesulfovibrio sp.]|uniref:nitroreductase family protein n=1 Tax=Maridesulfovibrio sp. TaxID=2795000 RepID=UPI0029C9BA1C|nr:nitroreductase family protein [Maridesulfovibrio sp.]
MLIKVDTDSCVQCGICVKACPVGVITFGNSGPEALSENGCNRCGHCVAVCPKDALRHKYVDISKQKVIDSYPVIDAETAENFLRSRRSIRYYKKKSVPREQLLQLVDIARFAPSASNSQSVSYYIIENRIVLDELLESVMEWMEKQIATGEFHHSFPIHVDSWKNGKDPVFRGAPHLIVAAAPRELKNRRDNTVLNLAYLELYAGSAGLGSCWAGLFEFFAADNEEFISKRLGLKKGLVLSGAVLVGFSAERYLKLVERNQLQVSWVE